MLLDYRIKLTSTGYCQIWLPYIRQHPERIFNIFGIDSYLEIIPKVVKVLLPQTKFNPNMPPTAIAFSFLRAH